MGFTGRLFSIFRRWATAKRVVPEGVEERLVLWYFFYYVSRSEIVVAVAASSLAALSSGAFRTPNLH